MHCTLASTEAAKQSLQLVTHLQQQLVGELEKFAVTHGTLGRDPLSVDPLGIDLPGIDAPGIDIVKECDTKFEKKEWQRDSGTHGGGLRFQAPVSLLAHSPFAGATALAMKDNVKQNAHPFVVNNLSVEDNPNFADCVNSNFSWRHSFNAASSNISQVHYEDLPEKPLNSATAISSIVHPAHPLLPSLHFHISYTEYKAGNGYWRIMADLNPSHPSKQDAEIFCNTLQQNSGTWYNEGIEQGDLYFYIPALRRHRGVAHFYLEQFSTGDFASDLLFAQRLGEAVIATYSALLHEKIQSLNVPSPLQWAKQLEYHSLYFLQVLTLDRGTTAGLLVHSNNDAGILASLPARVSPAIIGNWSHLLPNPQNMLLHDLLACLNKQEPSDVTLEAKQALANAARLHYQRHPEALGLQAKGKVEPPTVHNHMG